MRKHKEISNGVITKAYKMLLGVFFALIIFVAYAKAGQPNALTDLTAVKGVWGGEAVLSWSAPNDGGNALLSGSKFAVQYSTSPNGNPPGSWAVEYAQRIVSTNSVSPWTKVSYTVTGLTGGLTYYFKVLHCSYIEGDESWSGLSNTATNQALAYFVDINAGLIGVRLGAFAWGDYDNDGDLDLAMNGGRYLYYDYIPQNTYTKIYRNDAGSFSELTDAVITGVYKGDIAWGDYNSDGYLDIALTGQESYSTNPTKIYRNNLLTGGGFTEVLAGLTGMQSSMCAWGDYNNDGDLDIVISGWRLPEGNLIRVFENVSGIFSDKGAMGLDAVISGRIAWSDYDNDGMLDIALCGGKYLGLSEPQSVVYRNNGNVFSSSFTLEGVTEASLAWGDYDSDGDMDLVLSGYNGSNNVTKIYNNSSGDLAAIGTVIPGFRYCALAWGDYDNDGLLDIGMAGDSGGRYSTVFANTGTGFVDMKGSGLENALTPAFAWGDFDNDGRLDIALSGYAGTSYTSKIYKGYNKIQNRAPSLPLSPSVGYDKNNKRLMFSWNPQVQGTGETREETSIAGLQYEIGIATKPINGSLARWVVSPSTGRGKSPFMGNYPNAKVGTTQRGMYLKEDVLNFTSYYFRVRSIDSGFTNSSWTTPAVCYLTDVNSPAAVTNFVGVTGDGQREIKLFWTSSGDDGRTNPIRNSALIKIEYSQDPNISWSIENAQVEISTYGTNPGQVVSHILGGISSGVTYYMKLWYKDSYDNLSAVSNTATGWAKADILSPGAVTGLLAGTGTNEGEVILSWKSPGNDGTQGKLMEGSEFKIQYSTTSNGNPPGSWDHSFAQRTVSTRSVEPGSSVSYTLTGLDGNTEYYFKIWHKDEISNWSGISNTATGFSQRDLLVPGKVTVLAGQGKNEGEIALSWSVPGDNGYAKILQDAFYAIQRSTWGTLTYSTGSYDTVIFSTGGVNIGTVINITLTGLDQRTTYWISVWHMDRSGNWSVNSDAVSAYAQGDVTAPSSVTDLFSIKGENEGEAVLGWTVPGDDGMNGMLVPDSSFAIQYSSYADGAHPGSWDYGLSQVKISTHSVSTGTLVNYTVTGLEGDKQFYFKIWHADESGNRSGISNTATGFSQRDLVPPGKVTVLADPGLVEGQIRLSWGSPGDNGYEKTLQNGYYAIQRSTWEAFVWSTGSADTVIFSTGVDPGIPVSAVLSGLDAGINYWMAVWHADKYLNWSVMSDTKTAFSQVDVTSPSALSDLNAIKGVQDGEGILFWSSPGDDGALNTLALDSLFKVQFSTSSDGNPPGDWNYDYAQRTVSTKDVGAGAAVQYTLTGLQIQTNYFVKVWYADEAGNRSEASNIAELDVIPPESVTDLIGASTALHGEINLQWSIPGDDLSSGELKAGSAFKIQYSTSPDGNPPGIWSYELGQIEVSTSLVNPWDSVSHTVTGFVGGVTYYLSIWHRDESGNWSGLSNVTTAFAFDDKAPFGVTDLFARGGGTAEEAVLSWSMPGDDDTFGSLPVGSQFNIQYSTDMSGNPPGNWDHSFAQKIVSTAGVEPGRLVQYTITGIEIGKNYYFKVWHCDEVPNWSSPSNMASRDVLPPADITEISALPGAMEGEIYLIWAAPGNDGWERTLSTGSGFAVQFTSDTGGVPLSGWSYEYAQRTVSTYGVTAGSFVKYTVTGLPAGTTHYFRVWHYDEFINWSGQVKGATMWAQVDITPPGSVTTLSSRVGLLFGEVLLSWRMPGDDGFNKQLPDLSQFKVQYSTVSDGNPPGIWSYSYAQRTISTSGVESGSYVNYAVTGLLPNEEYYFKIWHGDEIPNWSEKSNTATSYARNFFIETGDILVGADLSSLAWGDFDNDNDLDLIVSGMSDAGRSTLIYKNESGSLTNIGNRGIENISAGDIAWGDFNNDGVLDLAITGDSDSGRISRVYRNNNGNFAVSGNFIGFNYSSLGCADYDNDGDIDLVITGRKDGPETVTRIYRNDGEIFTDMGSLGITGVINGGLLCGDYDSDGDLDVVISGYSPTGNFSSVFRNDISVSGSFSNAGALGLPAVSDSSLSWGDCDNDGFLDIAISGFDGSTLISRIYRNTTNGDFAVTSDVLAGIERGAVSWGDYDNDGKQDIVLCGYSGSVSISKVYRNGGSGFTSVVETIEGIRDGSAALGDMNGDGRLDLALSGNTGTSRTTKIYRSMAQQSNETPGVPANMSAVFDEPTKTIKFRWENPLQGTEKTPVLGLQYEIRVATALITDSIQAWIVSPSTGAGVSPTFGNYAPSKTAALEKGVNLNASTLVSYASYYWQVRSIDSGYNKSAWVAGPLAYVGDVTPPAAVTDLNAAPGIYEGEVKLSWSMPGDDIRVGNLPMNSAFKVQFSTKSNGNPPGSWSTSYAQRTVSTSGVEQGTVVSFTLTGLTSGLTYYFKIWHADDVGNWAGDSNSANSSAQIDRVSPGKVTDLSGSYGANGGEITLSWSTPGDNGNFHAMPQGSLFRIQYSTNPGAVWVSTGGTGFVQVSTQTAGPGVSVQYTVTGLIAEREYFLRMAYRDEANNWGIVSSTIVFTARPFDFGDIFAGLIGLDGSALSWGDFDNDGDLDLIVCGQYGVTPPLNFPARVARIYRNRIDEDYKGFEPFGDLPDAAVRNGAVAWGDYNNDGFLDIAIVGETGLTSKKTVIYRNTGSSTFTPLFPEIAAVDYPTIGWVDYNNDGYLDLSLTGDDSLIGTGVVSRLYRNIGGVFSDANIGITQVRTGEMSFGDYDNDGDLDLAICGDNVGGGSGRITKLYSNDAGVFSPALSSETFAPVNNGAVCWADFDNDGWLDIILSGSSSSGMLTSIYRNNSTGGFAKLAAEFLGSENPSISLGDLDNNGRTDIIQSVGLKTVVYENIDGLSFQEANNRLGVPGIDGGCVSFGDYDNDTRLDLAITGNSDSGRSTKIYRNNLTVGNIAPDAPTYSTATYSYAMKRLEIRWSGAEDYETPYNGLNYEVRMATTDVSGTPSRWILNVSPGKGVSPDFGKYPHGFAEKTAESELLPGVNLNRSALAKYNTHYWQIRAIDTAYARSSAWSPIGQIYIYDVQPPAAVNSLSASQGAYYGGLEISWNAPGDDELANELADGSQFVIQYSTWQGVQWSTSSTAMVTVSTYTSPISVVAVSTHGVSPGTSVRYTIHGLKGGATYYARIWHCDFAQNWSEVSNTAYSWAQTDSIRPGNTIDLSAGPGVIPRTANLYWSSPSCDGYIEGPQGALREGSKFLVRYSTVNASWQKELAQIQVSTKGTEFLDPVSYTVTGLIPNTTYYFGLWYADEFLNWSDPSNIAVYQLGRDTISPSGAVDQSAKEGPYGDQIQLTWSAPTDDEGSNVALEAGSYFKIQYSTWVSVEWSTGSTSSVKVSTNGVSPGSKVSYMLTGLTEDGTFYMSIWHVDKAGNWSLPSGTVSARTDLIAPSALTNLTASRGFVTGEIKLTWTSPGNNTIYGTLPKGTLFGVQCSSDPYSWSVLAASKLSLLKDADPGEKITHFVTGLVPGTTYYIMVWQADDRQNWSGASNNANPVSAVAREPTIFTEIPTGMPDLSNSDLAWGDYNNDGKLDIALCGQGLARVYNNAGNNSFVMVNSTMVPISNGGVSWGDFDSDGDLDLGVCGNDGAQRVTKLYRNDSGEFKELSASFLGVDNGEIDWGDYDNDGDLDFVFGGSIGDIGGVTRIYKNKGGGEFEYFYDLTNDIFSGSLAWGDYDNDGDLDLFQCKMQLLIGNTIIYKNNNNGASFSALVIDPYNVANGKLAPADYNNDGWLDILVSGGGGGFLGLPTAIMQKNIGGAFTSITLSDYTTGIWGGLNGSLSWGDYDNDGNIDVLTSGNMGLFGGVAPMTAVIKNQGNDSFVVVGSALAPIYNGNAVWGDYNNDSALDVALTGNGVTRLYRSDGVNPNTPPSIPAASSAVFNRDLKRLEITSEKVHDSETTDNGIYYETIVSTKADFSKMLISPTTGYGATPLLGNYLRHNISTASFIPGIIVRDYGLANFTTYYWKIRSIDAGLKKSTWSSVFSVVLDDVRSPAGISSLVAQMGAKEGAIDLIWRFPGSDGQENPLLPGSLYTISYSSNSNVSWDKNNSQITVSTGGMWLNETLTNHSITGFAVGTTQYFRIWHKDSYNNWSLDSNIAASLPQVDVTPPGKVTEISAALGNIEGEIRLSWRTPGDDEYEKTLSTGSLYWIQYSTQDSGWDRAKSQIKASTHSIPSGTWVSHIVTNLSKYQVYYLKVWHSDERENWSDISDYATSFAQIDVTPPGKVTQISAQSAVYGGQIFLTWSTPGDDGYENTLSTTSELRIAYSSHNFTWSKDNFNIKVTTGGLSPGSEITLLVTGLSAGDIYEFAVWYQDLEENWSEVSSTASAMAQFYDFTSPAQVTNLGGVMWLKEGEIRLSWSSPGDDVWSGALRQGSRFEVAYSTIAGVEISTQSGASKVIISTQGVSPGSSVNQLLTGLMGDTTHYIRMWYVDEVQNWSVGSNTTTIRSQKDVTPPGKVTTLVGETGINEGEVALSWRSAGDDEYTGVLSSGSQVWIMHSISSTGVGGIWNRLNAQVKISTEGVNAGDINSRIITGLTGGVTYYFRLWTKDEKAEEAYAWSADPSNIAFSAAQFDKVPPAKVTELAAFQGTKEGEIILVWESPGDDGWENPIISGAQFEVGYEKQGGPVRTIIVSTGGISPRQVVSYTLTGLENGATYYMKLKYCDEKLNYSDFSDAVTSWAQIDTIAPAVVSEIAAYTSDYEKSVLLVWRSPGDNSWEEKLDAGSSFRVQYSTSSDGNPPGNWDYGLAQVPVSTSGVIPGNVVSYNVTGLQDGVTYFLKMWYSDEAGNYWAVGSSTVSAFAQGLDNVPPSKVTDLIASPGVRKGEVNLRWSSPGDDGEQGMLLDGAQFRIQYSTTSTVSWSTAATEGLINISTSGIDHGANCSVTMTGLQTGMNWYFRLWTKDEVINWSEISNGATSYASFDNIKPAAITTLTVQAGVNEGEITLLWMSSGNDGFERDLGSGSEFRIVYSTTQSDVWNRLNAKVIISTQGVSPYSSQRYTVTGLKNGATYYSSIWVFDESGNSSDLGNYPAVWAQRDSIKPSTVNNLSAATGVFPGEVILEWNAPGDNGINGTLPAGSKLHIQCNDTNGWWVKENAQVKISTFGTPPSSPVKYTVTGLFTATTHYFRLWYADEENNWSMESTLAQAVPREFAASEFSIVSVSPAVGYDTGSIDVTIDGAGFMPGMEIKLIKFEQSDIVATDVFVDSPVKARCKFSLSQKVPGDWTVEIKATINFSVYSDQLVGGFKVKSKNVTAEEIIRKETGGTIDILPESGKMELTVPPNGFAEDIVITMSTDTVAGSEQASVEPTSIGFRITTDKGLQPLKGLTIAIWYRDSDVAEKDEKRFAIARYDEEWGRWIILPSEVYPAENKVVGVTTHLSRFALVYMKGAENLGEINVFPNPYNPNIHSQGFVIENITEDAELKIFTVSREFVRNVDYESRTGRAVWDGKNNSGQEVASGIYILYIKSGSGEIRRMKIAVEK